MGKPTQRTNEAGETVKGRKKRGICNFLLSLLEDESYPHVQWTNKEKGEFQIHWMHASSGAWVMNNDAETYRLWAKAKGKLEGREDNYKTWKANFRCAMKSRHELEEIPIPKGSPYRKKNVKFWKFNDMELVNGCEDGRKFDWCRPRTKSPARKPVRAVRARRNKRRTEKKVQPDDSESSRQSIDSCVEQMSLTIDEDSDFNSYGAGLLQILEQATNDKDSVVPNIQFGENSTHPTDCQNHNETENVVIHQYDQLPPFHQMSSPFSLDQPFSDDILLDQEWELFADEETKKEVKGATCNYLDVESNDVTDYSDPFLYESIYTQL